jgi:hypothetical protein
MAQTSALIPTDQRTQATPTLYNNLVNDLTELYSNWVELPSADWVASVTSSPDRHSITTDTPFPTGTRLRYKQGGGYKYAVVIRSQPDIATPAMLLGRTDDYILEDAVTITDAAVCFTDAPDDWPGVFKWTPTSVTGWSTPPDAETHYIVNGKVAHLRFETASGTSNANSIAFSNPLGGSFSSGLNTLWLGIARVTDNGAVQTTAGVILDVTTGGGLHGSLMSCHRDFTVADNWTTSGAKQIHSSQITFILD